MRNKKTKDEIPPDLQKVIEEQRIERDPIENKKTCPPKSETVYFNSLWIGEVFPPSYRSSLFEALNELDWAEKNHFIERNSPKEWLENARMNPWGGASFNLGILVSKEDKSIGHIRRVNLPSGISHAFASMHQILPSHTVIVIQFVLNDEEALGIDSALRKEYVTIAEKVKGGHTISRPFFRKKDATLALREEIYLKCVQWYKDNLPGFFSSLNREFPACEFITFKEAIPLQEESDREFENYMEILNLEHNNLGWVSNGFRLDLFDRGKISKLILSANLDEIEIHEHLLEQHKGNIKDSITHMIDYYRYWLAKWILLVQQESYEAKIAKLRDSSLITENVYDEDLIDKASFELLKLKEDASPFVIEINQIAKEESTFINEFHDVRFNPISDKIVKADFLEFIRTQIDTRSYILMSQLEYLEAFLLSLSNQASTSAQKDLTKSNNKLQIIIVILVVVQVLTEVDFNKLLRTLSNFINLLINSLSALS